MPSSSDTSSLRPGSTRSSLLRRLYPRGFRIRVTPIQSDTNSTATGLPGPGRVLGSLISRGGSRLEGAIDRFAEDLLGLGPTAAARRLSAALNDIHIRESRGRNDCKSELDASSQAADQLIWVCNGFCSRCDHPYLPVVLTELPESVQKAVLNLRRYLQSSQPPSNIGLASIYIRILIESYVLAPSLMRELDFLQIMQNTRETIWPSYESFDPMPDDLVALKAAVAAVDEAAERDHPVQANPMVRFQLEEVNNEGNTDVMHMLLESLVRAQVYEAWTSKEIESAKLLTKLSIFTRDLLSHISTSKFEELLNFKTRLQSWYHMPVYLVSSLHRIGVRVAAVLSSNHALILEGHSRRAWSVAWLLDGKSIISSTVDCPVFVWDPKTAARTAQLEGHARAVNSVAVSPDGTMFASGSDDQSVRLWDVKTRGAMVVLNSHTDSVVTVAFSPDSAQIASGSADKTIRLWDVNTGHESRVLTGHTDWVRSVAFSPNGLYLASGSDDESVRLWEMRTGRQTAVLSGHSLAVMSVAFSPNGDFIASGSRDNTIRLWDVRSRREMRKLNGHTHGVSSVAVSPDGEYLVSASWDSTLRLWNANTGHQVAVLRGHAGRVNSAVFSPDGEYIASGSNDKTIRVWDVSMLMSMNREGVSNSPTELLTEQADLYAIAEDSVDENDFGE